jgi:type VI secretion system secreted protein VgrG
MPVKGLKFTLNIDGIAETALAVVDFRLHQQHSLPFTLEIVIASSLFELEAKDFLEKDATLNIWQGEILQRSVNGIVATVALGKNDNWQICYTLTIHPLLWRCSLRKNSRIFQQQDIQQISAILLAENDVTDWTPIFYESHPPREFCVQYGETDLEFLTRLWSEEGIFFFHQFSPVRAKQILTLCDNEAGLFPVEDLPFNPNVTTDVSTECVSDFEYRAQIRPSSIETRDYTFKTPGWAGSFAHSATNLNGQYSQYEIFDHPGRFKDEQHGRDFARYKMEGWRQNAETASGSSTSPDLWPGTTFVLTGHPSAALNREWQVVSSILRGDQPQAQHGSQGQGTTMSNGFEVIPADRTWRTQPPSKPKIDGPQSAIVTGPAGEEIFCDEHGRVRVKFHWDRYHQKNEHSSCWVRVSQAWAGSGFGNLAIPRVGQEVIVDFLNGDPDQPIIMGRTYHQDNRSPGSLPGTKTQMAIRSKTYKGSGYNELMFEDSTGQELLSMHAQKDMDTKVLHDRKTTVIHDHTENIGNDQKVRIKKDRKVLIGHDLRQVVLNNQKTTTIKNKKDFTGITSTETVGVMKTVTVGGLFQTTVAGEMNTSVALAQTEQVGLLKSVIVGGPLEVSSATCISFTCGLSSITLDVSGKVTISGTTFDFSATGPVNINGKDVDIN